MKKILVLVIVIIAFIAADAQTFYELQFTVPGDETYTGLLTYYDEQNVKIRLTSPKTLANNGIYEGAYKCQIEDKDSADDVGMMFYVPDGDADMPMLMWTWSADDASDIADEPVVIFDLNDADTWIRADHFVEVPLKVMDAEYVSQFYNPDEEEYALLLSGASTVNGNDIDTQEVTDVTVGKAAMHLIVLANTRVSDIGQACRVDLSNVESEFRGIAKATGLDLHETIIAGDDYGKEALAKAISSLKPGKADVVVFVYSGHGFRFNDQKDYYPNMDLSATSYDKATDNYMPLSDVFKAIKAKGARLNIVLSDCCNSVVDANRPVIANNSLFSRSNNSFDAKKLRKLFVGSKGNVLATAARPGQMSWCGSNGGYFLLSFIESLRNNISALSDDEPSWSTVISNALENAAKKSADNAMTRTQNGMKYVKVE